MSTEGGQEVTPIPAGDQQMQVERSDQTPDNSQGQSPSPQRKGRLSFLTNLWTKVAGGIEKTAVGLDKAGVDPNRIIPPATGVYPRSEQPQPTKTPSNEPSQS